MLANGVAQAPKCKLCGVAHFGNEHVWPTGPKPKVGADQSLRFRLPQKTTDYVVTDDSAKDRLIAELRAKIAELEPDAAKARQYRESQRELMRRRRAKT